jgi:hypothetical protein
VEYNDDDDGEDEEQKKGEEDEEEKRNRKKFLVNQFFLSNPLHMILHPCRSKTHSSVLPDPQKERQIPKQRVVFNP